MRLWWLLLPAVLCAFAFTACMRDPNATFSAARPDQVLFARGRSAAEHHRLDIARMRLQTLVNPYPDSEYAAEAKRVLNDPRLQGCGSSDGMQFSETAFSPCGSMPGVVDGSNLCSLGRIELSQEKPRR